MIGTTWTRICSFAIAVCVCSLVMAQSPSHVGGSWDGPFDWSSMLGVLNCPPPLEEHEISQAALIPRGLHAGKVIFWRNQFSDCQPPNNEETTGTWLFDPQDPGEIIRIDQNLDSQIFCSGMSWQKTGNLLVVGGLTFGQQEDAKETYRFKPGLLGPVRLEPEESGNKVISSQPWAQLDDMVLGRYYPTVIGLNSHTLSMPTTGTPVEGASSFVLGGPPSIAMQEGTEIWEINSPGSTAWSAPLLPGNATNPPPNEDDLPMGTSIERYDLKGALAPPNDNQRTYLFTSYPRAFQLTTEQIFVAGDVNTSLEDTRPPNMPANDTGLAWVIENADISTGSNWEFWDAEPALDRYFGTAVLLHKLAARGERPPSDAPIRLPVG